MWWDFTGKGVATDDRRAYGVTSIKFSEKRRWKISRSFAGNQLDEAVLATLCRGKALLQALMDVRLSVARRTKHVAKRRPLGGETRIWQWKGSEPGCNAPAIEGAGVAMLSEVRVARAHDAGRQRSFWGLLRDRRLC